MPTSGQVSNDAPAFTITELTGDQRVIKLLARALPYRPVEFEGDQRMDVTWYGGNPEATSQMLGPQEMPTELHGFWKDKFLSDTADVQLAGVTANGASAQVQPTAIATRNGTPLKTTIDLTEEIDDIRRKGQRLEVQWGHLIRRGHLRKFRQRWWNPADCEWSMVFEWTGFAEPSVPAVLPTANTAGQVQGQFQAAISAMRSVVAKAERIQGDVLLAVTGAISTIDSAVGLIDDLVSNTADTTITLMSAARRAGGIMAEIQSTSQDLADLLDATPAALVYGIPIDQVSFGDEIAADEFNRQIGDLSRQMARDAARAQQDLARQVAPNLLGIYIARDGDDLRNVAVLFYGSADDWQSIMVFNELAGSKLIAGTVVYVPIAQQALAA